MTSSQQYDAIVIGSGQAGTPLSTALAQAGMRTALIEREHVGGTPQETFKSQSRQRAAQAAELARRVAEGVGFRPVISPCSNRQFDSPA